MNRLLIEVFIFNDPCFAIDLIDRLLPKDRASRTVMFIDPVLKFVFRPRIDNTEAAKAELLIDTGPDNFFEKPAIDNILPQADRLLIDSADAEKMIVDTDTLLPYLIVDRVEMLLESESTAETIDNR
jgi:hypothetical protein